MSTLKSISIPITDQQHLLFLFVPLKKGKHAEAAATVEKLKEDAKALKAAADQPDLRKATGVHYFMIYPQADGTSTPGIPVPGFTSFPGKDVLVVMSIYDGQFDAYIDAFFASPTIVFGLNHLMSIMDESGLPPFDPTTSAKYISENEGVVQNAAAFFCLLMRYNFGDPVLSAGAGGGKYVFGTNFPGLTVAKVIDNYPGAAGLWPPTPGEVTYTFPAAQKPDCS
jgi:hypothetical protein